MPKLKAQLLKRMLSFFLLKIRGQMNVYNPTGRNHTIYVKPAFHEKEVSEWKHENGSPKMFTIKFKNGCATVDDNLGRFLIDRGLAKETMIIMPNEIAANAKRISRVKRVC